jgi:hypothetical protein
VAFDPLTATGLVVAQTDDGREVFCGTAFLFRHEHVALTADHCVPESARVIHLVLPRLNRTQEVLEVHRHPTADIAVLIGGITHADSGGGYPEHAFWDRVSNWGLAEEFLAFGYPDEGPTPEVSGVTPVPRSFVGHFQRFFNYSSPNGYRYLAGEMSIPAPSGLSGGPVFRRGAPSMLTAMVTANVETYAVTDSLEEVRSGGEVLRLESRRVLSYGLCLMLSEVSDWLHEIVPDRPDMGWVS